jgi:hypothetical protein
MKVCPFSLLKQLAQISQSIYKQWIKYQVDDVAQYDWSISNNILKIMIYK